MTDSRLLELKVLIVPKHILSQDLV